MVDTKSYVFINVRRKLQAGKTVLFSRWSWDNNYDMDEYLAALRSYSIEATAKYLGNAIYELSPLELPTDKTEHRKGRR